MRTKHLVKVLSVCSVALVLLVGVPALAQDEVLDPEQLTREEDPPEELLSPEEADEAVMPLAVPFIVRQVAVECNGNCNDSTLGQLCGSGWKPIAVDCQNVQEWGGSACGGNNKCSRFSVLTTDPLSFYCDDINGWDANVYCAQ